MAPKSRPNKGLLAAMQLIMRIEARLTYGQAIVNKDGKQLTTLAEVIEAKLTNNLAEETI